MFCTSEHSSGWFKLQTSTNTPNLDTKRASATALATLFIDFHRENWDFQPEIFSLPFFTLQLGLVFNFVWS